MLPYQLPVMGRPAPARVVARALGEPVPPPGPDPIFTGYTGITGSVEAGLVLAITAAAAWAGIRTGMGKGSQSLKAAGWVGGVGSALLGLLYVGGKMGLNVGLPAVRVTPS